MQPSLGVCYYPEHWPEAMWEADAALMAKTGIRFVRIGEFAWSRMEPRPGEIDLGWLIRAMDVLHRHGLKVVMGTPTATPPRWVLSKWPDMLARDVEGRERKFGSRRHYCFSHMGYRDESARITRILAEALKDHPALAVWQTDNEYGCHDTVLSYSASALAGFRDWLKTKYKTIDALNLAWGNVFWSMEYSDFAEIDLPNLQVTEATPTHYLDFRRFASDEVVAFNQVQVAVLRALTPDIPITHNFMGSFTQFDHFNVAADMEIAAWDSYPIGRLEMREGTGPLKTRFARQGDPDMQAFTHDIYRAVGRGRMWVMEQQPGPVNWAPYNADPLPGMARLWAWEAFAHGAEVVSYFRWRQAPFAQEQMHAGLMRPDNQPAPALGEAAAVHAELEALGAESALVAKADCAIVFDYESEWAWESLPQAKGFSHQEAVYDQYRHLRALGLDVDIISAHTRDLSAYKLVFVPALFAWNDDLKQAMTAFEGQLVIGPRSGSKTPDFHIPDSLPPGLPRNFLDVKVVRVATLAPDVPVPLKGGGQVVQWLDKIETGAEILIKTEDGWPVLVRQGHVHYLAGLLDGAGLQRVTEMAVRAAGLKTHALPDGLRLRRTEAGVLVFNYSLESHDLAALGFSGPFGLDGQVLAPAGVAHLPG